MALTVKQIEKLEPGRYADGHGLYLQVAPTGGRAWLLRYQRGGRERWLGLGPLHTFPLAEARKRAQAARAQLYNGIDPIDAKRAQKVARALEEAKRITFRDAMLQYFEQHQKKWSSAKHRQQFTSAMRDYAIPVIGKLPVAAVDTGLVLKIVEPIWESKTQTANRVRGWVESVLDWSTVRGYRSGDNPARWQGHLGEVLPARAQISKTRHHAAMPHVDVPGLMAQLGKRQGIPARALEFLILTAARSGEVLGARWDEFDLDKKLWIVPAERMKARKEHRVPLSPRAIDILRALPREAGFVFIGAIAGRPLGKMALPTLVASLGPNVTTHGFRSSFRDWCGEQTNFPREICEAALAHKLGDASEQAYARSDLLAKRGKLMEQWARYCAAPPKQSGKHSGVVVPMRGRK